MKEKLDESQIKNHARRNRSQKKDLKTMIYHLDLLFGEQGTPMIIAMVLDCLNKMMDEKTPSDFLSLRTVEIRFNDFYSVKLDCDTREYIE